MARSVLALMFAACAVCLAGAVRAAPDISGHVGAALVAAAVEADGGARGEAAAALAHGGVEAVWTLSSGAQIVLAADGRVALDPARPDGRPSGFGPATLVSPASRAGPARSGRRATVEATRLSVALRTGWGEIALGRGAGAAALATADPDPAFAALGLDDPLLDPTGLIDAGASNDVSGTAPKLVARSPRLIGVELAASFAPRADSGDRARGFGGPGEPVLRDIAEIGASFERRIGAGELTAGLGWLGADMDRTPGAWGRYEALSALAAWRSGGWRLAARTLSADNGRPGATGRRTFASASVSRDLGAWRIELASAGGEDRLARQESRSVSLGAVRAFGQTTRIGLNLSHTRRTTDFAPAKRAFGAAVELAFTHW